MITFTVYGIPGPQGSKRHVGGGRMIESSAKVKPWREAVKAAAEAARKAVWIDGELHQGLGPTQIITCKDLSSVRWETLPTLDGPLVVRMVFTLPKPKNAPKKRKTYPDRKPDVSKLARSTEDALTDAGLIADDARIVGYSRLEKVFPNEDPEALESPGVRITITAKGEATA